MSFSRQAVVLDILLSSKFEKKKQTIIRSSKSRRWSRQHGVHKLMDRTLMITIWTEGLFGLKVNFGFNKKHEATASVLMKLPQPSRSSEAILPLCAT